MEVRRSVLFMAINNPRFLRGAQRHDCDGIILDLEDAVAEPHKAYARTLPRQAGAQGSRLRYRRCTLRGCVHSHASIRSPGSAADADSSPGQVKMNFFFLLRSTTCFTQFAT